MVKPKVYEIASQTAEANLDLKICILADFVTKGLPWVADGNGVPIRDPESGHRVIDFVPMNDLQFARWSCESGGERALRNCDWVRKGLVERFGYFRGHGVDTLKKRPLDYERIWKLFEALVIAAKRQRDAEDPGTRLEELEAEVERLTASSAAMAALVQRSLEEKEEHLTEIGTLKRAFSSAKRVYAENEAEAEAELQKRDDQISKLRRELNEKLRLVRK